MSVTLRDITRDNWIECTKLEVREDQKGFVTPNVFSIAQWQFEPTFTPQAVYHGEEMVGFIMYGFDTDEGCHWVGRMMIDKNHQGRGYGRAAMVEAIRRMRERPDCRDIGLCLVPENAAARRLYESLGFVKTGAVYQGEDVMRLRFDEPAGVTTGKA